MTNELDSFKANGYFVAKNLLDERSVRTVLRSITKTFRDQSTAIPGGLGEEDAFSAMRNLHRLDLERYKKIAGVLWRKLDVYQFMHDPRIIDFLCARFGWRDIFVPGGQVVHIMADELKIPGGYFGLAPHQDFPSLQGSLDGVVVWIPLITADRDNFPLEVIPGSHKRGVWPMTEDGSAAWEIRPDQYREEDFIPAVAQAGDVVFLSLFTVHRSSIHATQGKCRISVSTRFDNADEETYKQRAYPSAYERTVHRAPYFPGFPTAEQIEATFRNADKS